MSVYRILADHENYMTFFVENHELRAKMGENFIFHIDSTPNPQNDHWVAPNVSFYTPDDFPGATKVPDITNWGPDKLVINDKVKQKIDFSNTAEVLPVFCENIPYYVLNVLQLATDDDIDHSQSEQEFEEGYFVGLKSLVFIEDKVKDFLIFKTEFDRFMGLYCTDKFKDMVENAGYEGAIFREDLLAIF